MAVETVVGGNYSFSSDHQDPEQPEGSSSDSDLNDSNRSSPEPSPTKVGLELKILNVVQPNRIMPHSSRNTGSHSKTNPAQM